MHLHFLRFVIKKKIDHASYKGSFFFRSIYMYTKSLKQKSIKNYETFHFRDIFFIPRSKEMAFVYEIGKKDLENSKFQF